MRNIRARAIRQVAIELRRKYPKSNWNIYRRLKRHYMEFKNLKLPASKIIQGL